MPVHSIISYHYNAIQGNGTHIYLRPDYDPDQHLVRLDVTEDVGDNLFNGDSVNDNVGDDTTQHGDFYKLDGTPMANGQVYIETSHLVEAPDGTQITLWGVSVGGLPAVYVTSEPLLPGTNYLILSTTDVTPANAPLYSDIGGAPCFCAGTVIDTQNGPKAVEALCPGDTLLTRDHGAQDILWIGYRHIGPFELRAASQFAPVILNTGSIGPNMPNRPLFVSQQHRVLMEGAQAELHFGTSAVFVPAKALVNDTTIRISRQLRDLQYYHILLAEHAALLSNQLWTESLLLGDIAFSPLGPKAKPDLPTAMLEKLSAQSTAYPAVRAQEGRVLAPKRRTTKPLPRVA